MKILVVGLIKGSQIQRFKEEAEKLGHTVEGCYSSDLIIKSNGKTFEALIKDTPLTDYDVIYLCAGVESKFRYEWFVASDYLVNHSKTKVVNRIVIDQKFKYYPVQSWFYLRQFENLIASPKTYTIYKDKSLRAVSSDLGYPMIIKLSETHQGKGIFLVKNEDEARKVIKNNKGKAFLLRKFIPNDGDIRVFTVGFKAIGAMKRIASTNDFRSNISQGGTGEVFDLEKNPEIRAMAEKSARATGIEIAGVDIMIGKEDKKPYLLEVNTGPQFKGLEKYTKVNVAGEVIKYFASLR